MSMILSIVGIIAGLLALFLSYMAYTRHEWPTGFGKKYKLSKGTANFVAVLNLFMALVLIAGAVFLLYNG